MFKKNLIEDCKKGKRAAQFKLYEQYCDGMLCIAMRYLKQKDVAEDAVQEAFIKAFKNIAKFDGSTSFGAWIKRFVINQSIDFYRQKKYHVELDKHSLEMVEDSSHTWEVEDYITSEDVQFCIDKIPEKQATVLKLYLLEGYDHEEIADILQINATNSRILLHRGKKLLKEQLNTLKHERLA